MEANAHTSSIENMGAAWAKTTKRGKSAQGEQRTIKALFARNGCDESAEGSRSYRLPG